MRKDTVLYYRIADFNVQIIFRGYGVNGENLIPSFAPFKQDEATGKLLLQLEVDDNIKPFDKECTELIGRFDTGNGNTAVWRMHGSERYQYIIKDINGADCCLLQSDQDFSHCKCALNVDENMRRFGLNNAIMLAFSFRSSYKSTLLIHASLVRHNGYGYAFTAKSGTGKSTHVSLWLRHIEGCDLMNDDNPIVRVIDGKAYIYGSPWSGKTPCYRNTKAMLGAITRIDRAKANSIEKLSATNAFASMLTSCSQMKWDKVIFDNVCNTITNVIEVSDIYILHCIPNKEAAIICHNAISK